jgi:hypothetical protein
MELNLRLTPKLKFRNRTSRVPWWNRSFLCVTPWVRRVRVTKDRLYSKERKSIVNHERSNDTAEKLWKNRKATLIKVGNNLKYQPWLSGMEEKLKHKLKVTRWPW